MAVKVCKNIHDTVGEACIKLDISRNTLLDYIRKEIVSPPPTVKKGRTLYRYFTDEWYAENKPKIDEL